MRRLRCRRCHRRWPRGAGDQVSLQPRQHGHGLPAGALPVVLHAAGSGFPGKLEPVCDIGLCSCCNALHRAQARSARVSTSRTNNPQQVPHGGFASVPMPCYVCKQGCLCQCPSFTVVSSLNSPRVLRAGAGADGDLRSRVVPRLRVDRQRQRAVDVPPGPPVLGSRLRGAMLLPLR